MRLSDIQPHYFPRLHYFARMLESDVFVLRDDVQFVRNHRYPGGRRGVSYQAHAPIKGPDGPLLLGVSVKKGSGRSINETEIAYEQGWTRKHLNLIKQHYRRAPELERLLPGIKALLEHRWATLADLDIATVCWGLGHLLGATPQVPDDLRIERVNQWLAARVVPCRLQRIELGSASAPGSRTGDASRRIVELCRDAGADEYLAGGTAVEAYLDPRPFLDRGIEITVQRWTCPEYPQQRGTTRGHVANLSILDLLLNTTRASARLFL